MRNFIILLIIVSCVEPYDFELKGTQRYLVVDASITNIAGLQHVNLSYSYPLEGTSSEPVTGASVSLSDDQGGSVLFIEREPGIYRPGSSFKGVPGREYQLAISTPNGSQYLSEEVEMLQPGQLKDVYGRFLTLESETGSNVERKIQFLVDMVGNDTENYSYRFEYEEDYEIKVPYESVYEFNEDDLSISIRNPRVGTCYANEKSGGLFIATTSGQVSSFLTEYPLISIRENERKLINRYSISVRSFRISSKNYQYYKDLEENNKSAGSFFDRQKGALVGNITNIENPSEPVLGYFEVAGVSENFRVFEKGTWEEDGFNPDGLITNCTQFIDTVLREEVTAGGFDFDGKNIIGLSTLIPPEVYLAPPNCSDCRVYGELNKPHFWD